MPYSHDEEVTGQDATLKWGEKQFSVSSVSWSRDTNTTDVQHNDGLTPKILTTGIRFSGSFEYNGRQFELMNELVHRADGVTYDKHEPNKGTLSVVETVQEINSEAEGNVSETKYIYTFTGVTVTSQSRDLPADDSASTSWDWEAENMSVKKKNV